MKNPANVRSRAIARDSRQTPLSDSAGPATPNRALPAETARGILMGLWLTADDPTARPRDWAQAIAIAAQFTRPAGVSRKDIDQARAMTAEELILAATAGR